MIFLFFSLSAPLPSTGLVAPPVSHDVNAHANSILLGLYLTGFRVVASSTLSTHYSGKREKERDIHTQHVHMQHTQTQHTRTRARKHNHTSTHKHAHISGWKERKREIELVFLFFSPFFIIFVIFFCYFVCSRTDILDMVILGLESNSAAPQLLNEFIALPLATGSLSLSFSSLSLSLSLCHKHSHRQTHQHTCLPRLLITHTTRQHKHMPTHPDTHTLTNTSNTPTQRNEHTSANKRTHTDTQTHTHIHAHAQQVCRPISSRKRFIGSRPRCGLYACVKR